MERVAMNPSELRAELAAASAAIAEDEHEAHMRHAESWRIKSSHEIRHNSVMLNETMSELRARSNLNPDHAKAAVALSLAGGHLDQVTEQTTEEEMEDEFQSRLAALPAWQNQITTRGILVGCVLGALFCIVTHKLYLTLGLIPSLNIAAGLLAFFSLKSSTALVRRMGWQSATFNAQECNVVQTFVTACSGVAFTGGFGCWLIALDWQSYLLLGTTNPANRPQDTYQPDMSRVIPYLLCTSMIGVFILVTMRKTMIIDYNLTYPSGTATGLMVHSLFTNSGLKTGAMQLSLLQRFFGIGFLWDLVMWIMSGTNCAICEVSGVICQGISSLPIFGMNANQWTWNLGLTPNIIGAGMICPHIVNVSVLLGAILTFGWLWPFVNSKQGDWYAAGLSPTDFAGLYGYKVFVTISLMMGDGCYNLVKVFGKSALAWYRLQRPAAATNQPATDGCSVYGSTPGAVGGASASDREPLEPQPSASLKSSKGLELTKSKMDFQADMKKMNEEKEKERQQKDVDAKESAVEKRVRDHVFLSESIPAWISPVGYIAFAILGAVVVPFLYQQTKWYYVVCAFAIGPFLALPIAFGMGLTDWDMSSTMGKLSIFIFASWAGLEAGGVVVGLVMCGVIMAVCSTSATLMQDFRTGYIVKSAPRAMFAAQLMGTGAGALLAPLTFAMFWSTGEVGVPGGEYPAPYATVFRGMAIFATEGVGSLPKHCTTMMGAFFLGAIAIDLLKDFLPAKAARFVPIPIAMAVPQLLGAYIGIDMCIGSAIVAIWEWRSPKLAMLLAPAVASGLIVGDGVWSIPMSILGVAGVMPPVCAAFTGPSFIPTTMGRR